MLSFTDEQIKSLTQQVIDAPTLIAQANANVAAAQDNKAKALAIDNQNAVYTTDAVNNIGQYQTEYKVTSGTQGTLYDVANIPPAGQLQDGIHFPKSPMWTKMYPKLHDSNNGLPTSSYSPIESEAYTRATPWITLMQSGWTASSPSSTNLNGTPSGGVYPVNSISGFSVGNTVLIQNSSPNGGFVYGTVTGVTASTPGSAGPPVIPPTSASITVTTLLSYGSVTSSDLVRNYNNGYSVSYIEATSTDRFLIALQDKIDLAVSDWKDRLNIQLTALNANDSIAEKSQIASARTLVGGHVTTITTWQARPATGSGLSRFGTYMSTITTMIAARPAEITARQAQIVTALGSVSQASDGSFSGTGWYYTLFNNLNMRLNLAGGSLRSYYQADLGVTLFQQQAANAQSLADRNSATFTILFFAADGTGSSKVTLLSVTGISVGNTVKVMSSTQDTIITATITAIANATVTLSVAIPNTYKSSEYARVVKQN